MRLKLVFSYDGSKFQGSQTQPHENGVEDALGVALAHVGIFSKIISSSRTDKGVHANNQVACVECGEHFKDFVRLRSLVNRHAHPAIHVKFISRVKDGFHPRYDATARAYRYVINHGEFSPFLSPYETFIPKFDLNLANELLALFVGEHDFSAFMKLGSDVKSPVRRVSKAFCYERGERTIIVFKANGFLRAQVRLMVASVLKALELAKSGKFRQTQVQEFKFECTEAANLDANLNKNSRDNILTKSHESVNLAAEQAECVASKFDAKNSNLNGVANNCRDENFLKAKELLRQAIYEQKPLTRIPAPPNGLYLNRVFY
ncbi:tRNA pseudouridine synthase I [Campylobacter showae]|uniref:tRNA pseudouridine synthase A n=1 Tax=Campylobacter showae RM3277 TaxID=553219 RepID=C6RFI4_9BACT|nr:tRNA pseudouridine(38-40) synthase TruA [Campylobacter showae]EET79992.1 tRNA pseudouridine synthase A [Campylobacter showae RM3277]QCD48815.1 tRNA pseudouridine synthase I [Campylobacter showae]